MKSHITAWDAKQKTIGLLLIGFFFLGGCTASHHSHPIELADSKKSLQNNGVVNQSKEGQTGEITHNQDSQSLSTTMKNCEGGNNSDCTELGVSLMESIVVSPDKFGLNCGKNEVAVRTTMPGGAELLVCRRPSVTQPPATLDQVAREVRKIMKQAKIEADKEALRLAADEAARNNLNLQQ